MVKAMLSFPDAMRAEIERKGMEWWARGGEFDGFSAAIDEARRVSEEKNFPIQVACMGKKIVIYPKSIGY